MIEAISHKDLMHHRLQAILRDNHFDDFSYVGVHNGEHVYNIAGHIVPVTQIEGFDQV